MAVNMVTLLEPQSGTKRPKLTTPKNDAFAMVLPKHRSYGYSEVLIWFRDNVFTVVICKCEMPVNLQDNEHALLMVKRQLGTYNFR